MKILIIKLLYCISRIRRSASPPLINYGKQRGDVRGQLLIEMMVAMSVLMISLLGIFALLSQSLALSRVAANQYIAANLAAEGIEVVKNILDSNVIDRTTAWNDGLAVNGDFGVQYDSVALNSLIARDRLLFDPRSRRYNYTSGTQTSFVRVVSIDNISQDEIKVTSRVEWIDRGGLKMDIEVESRFLNWRAEL